MVDNGNAIRFDPASGILTFRQAGADVTWRLAVEADGRRLESSAARAAVEQAKPLCFALEFPSAGLAWHLRAQHVEDEGRPLYPDSYFYPATFVINQGGFWTGPGPALQNQASSYYTHRRLYINDSGNVLTVDKPLPASDARIHATIHAMSGGPTMLGDDIDRMDEERLALIKMTLPRPREVAFPVDLFDSPAPDHPHLFHRRAKKPWGRFDVLAVYNFGAETLRRRVELAELGLRPDAPYCVWELWNCQYVGRTTGALEAAVPPGSVKVYRLAEYAGAPLLLGTDMHVLMGEMEIEDCRWDAARGALEGRAVRPEGERGSVYLLAPENCRVTNPRGLWIAKDARDGSLIVRCLLEFPGGQARWSVGFEVFRQAGKMHERDLRQSKNHKENSRDKRG